MPVDTALVAAKVANCFGRGGDCTVVTRGEPISVWSMLLREYSSVFEAMFSQDCLEAATLRVEILDFPEEAVRAFFRFMYCGVLDVSPETMFEVWGLANKYAVAELEDYCMKAIECNLSPVTAGATMQRSLALGMSTVTDACRDLILNSAEEALPNCFMLSREVLEDLLSSPLLRINDHLLALLLLRWHPAGTGHDIGALLERHVRVVALSSEQHGEVMSAARQAGVGLVERLAKMAEQRKPGQHTEDVFACLYANYRLEYPLSPNSGYLEQAPFLGYWLNLIPASSSFCKVWVENRFSCELPRCPSGGCRVDSHRGRKLTVGGHEHVGNLQKMAANEMDSLLEASNELTWWLPHHRLYANQVSFHSALGARTCLEVLFSTDSAVWRPLVSVSTGAEEKREVSVPFLAKERAQWFRLRLVGGSYCNRLRIGGILQTI